MFPSSKGIDQIRFFTETDPRSIKFTIFEIMTWFESNKIDHRASRNGVGYYVLQAKKLDKKK